jgi:hypothetical protein
MRPSKPCNQSSSATAYCSTTAQCIGALINLLAELYNAPTTDDDTDGYYVAAIDGSVGYTTDDGYNIQWIYKAVKLDDNNE